MARDLPTGLVRTATGFRTFVWVPDPANPSGRVQSKRWKSDATITEMRQWREDQRVAARTRPAVDHTPPTFNGFAVDVATYLLAVRAMPSIKDRARDMAEWIARFGDRPSLDVQARDIRAARDAWLTIGPKRVQVRERGRMIWTVKPIPLAASTVNHRLRALENFFTVMYPDDSNPVRDVPEATEPPPQPRGQTFALALEIVAHIPDVTRPEKGKPQEAGSLSRARIAAMLWTGLPAVQIGRLQPDMIDWTARTMQPPRRHKGRQSRRASNRRIDPPRPLLPQAVDALTHLFALNANRPFQASSVNKTLKRAIAAANRARKQQKLPAIPPLRVYDLTRHTFGTEAMRASGNLKAVQVLMGHRTITQTERYAAAAVTEHTALAMAQLAAAAPGGKVGGKVSPPKSAIRDRTRRTRPRRKANK